jgi:hypothetical protein
MQEKEQGHVRGKNGISLLTAALFFLWNSKRARGSVSIGGMPSTSVPSLVALLLSLCFLILIPGGAAAADLAITSNFTVIWSVIFSSLDRLGERDHDENCKQRDCQRIHEYSGEPS